MSLTCLPRRVSQCLRVLGPCFHHRHHLVFSWLLVLHLVYGDRANLKELSRHGPAHLAYQLYRCLLCAAYWPSRRKRAKFRVSVLSAFQVPVSWPCWVASSSRRQTGLVWAGVWSVRPLRVAGRLLRLFAMS
jgi:hypothetical protein